MRILSFLLFGLSLHAVAFEAPRFVPNVVDTTGTLSAAETAQLNQTISTLRAQEIWAAVMVAPLQGESIEDVAEQTFRAWKLGQAGRDNGLLIVVAPQERRMRIEVGAGLEGALTDYNCTEVIERMMKPAFKSGKFARGIDDALHTLSQMAAGKIELPAPRSQWHYLDWTLLLQQIGLWAFLFFVPQALISRQQLKTLGNRKSPGLTYFSAQPGIDLRYMRYGAWNFGGLLLKFFILAFFSIPFFIAQFQYNDIPAYIAHGILGLFAVAFTLGAHSSVRLLIDDEAFAKYERRINQVEALTQNFRSQSGYRSGSRSSSSGTTSSSSRSSSSSSGGGRSSGGGASGSW